MTIFMFIYYLSLAMLVLVTALYIRAMRNVYVKMGNYKEFAIVLRSNKTATVEPVKLKKGVIFETKKGEVFISRPEDWFVTNDGRRFTVVVEGSGVSNPVTIWYGPWLPITEGNLMFTDRHGNKIALFTSPPPKLLDMLGEELKDKCVNVISGFAATISPYENPSQARMIANDINTLVEILTNIRQLIRGFDYKKIITYLVIGLIVIVIIAFGIQAVRAMLS